MRNSDKEISYYISLGYTQKQASRIASLNFERPHERIDRKMTMRFASGGGMLRSNSRKASIPVDEEAMEAPMLSMMASAPQAGMMMASAPQAGMMPMGIMGSALPGISVEDVRSDEYEHIEEIGAQSTASSPTSTFRTTFNTAAAAILLGNFREGTRFSHDMIRTEELLNFVPYDLKEANEKLFEVTTEMTHEGDKGFLFLGIKAKDVVPTRKNIVLLIDTSGSMCDKTLQIRATLATVFASLHEDDVFSLVTYSSEDHTFLNGMKVDKKHDIDYVLDKLKGMYIEGGTYGSKGIETAYTIVEENYIDDGINRVILVTDGDLNFGITDKGGLIDLIEKKRETGAYLSCIGTGLYNLRDDKLEALAKNGNGNYFVVNNIADVKEILYRKYNSLVFPVAKNVKAQVEFNPAIVKGYRLIGYENRRLTHEQFRDDKVVAEPFGSGAYCVACYELFFSELENVKPLKYQAGNTSGSEDIGTLTVRYQKIQNDEYEELEFVIENNEASSENIRKARKCADLAEVLRGDESEGKKRKAVREYLELFAGTEYAESFED